jgi:hypothetical protein
MQSQFRYLHAPGVGPHLAGRLTEVPERAIAVHESAICVAYVALGHAVERCTLQGAGAMSDTILVEPSIEAAHEGIAKLSGIAGVALLCASSVLGQWQEPALRSVERLANHDRAVIEEWRGVATRLVQVHQFSITKVAEALMAHGALSGDDVLRAAHAPDPVPTPHASEAEDQAQVAEWQRVQRLMTNRLRHGLARSN